MNASHPSTASKAMTPASIRLYRAIDNFLETLWQFAGEGRRNPLRVMNSVSVPLQAGAYNTEPASLFVFRSERRGLFESPEHALHIVAPYECCDPRSCRLASCQVFLRRV